MRSKVSVIVPIYNVERFLPRCVESLRRQTLQDIEIILVDDQSPDNCPTMCDKYQEQDERIKVIHKQNGGLGYARNSGLEIATGEYIAFVDSDDYVDLDMFQIMYSVAKENEADIVRVDNYKETVEGEILNSSYVPPIREGKYSREEMLEQLLYPQFGMMPEESGDKYVSCSVWRNIYKNKIIKQNEIKFVSERELISEDMPFNLEFMLKAESAYVLNRKFYHYIVNDKSLTQTYRPDRFQRELILYHELIRRLKTSGIYEHCQVRMYRHLLDRSRQCIKSELCANSDKRSRANNIKRILESEEMQHIFATYPLKHMPLKYRVVYSIMKLKAIFLLSLIKSKL